MPARRRGVSRIKYELTMQQEMELLLGPGGRPSHFQDDAERQAAWQAHRDALLEACPAGHRPAAWWQYEQGRDYRPHGGDETLTLLDIGVIGVDEMRQLERQWRLFERTARAVADLPRPAGSGRLNEEIYRERRRWYGIPDWFQGEEVRA